MSEMGYTNFRCPHGAFSAPPWCPEGCYERAMDCAQIVPEYTPSPPEPVTCPACLGTARYHDHGCRFCGEWPEECRCAEELHEENQRLRERLKALGVEVGE